MGESAPILIAGAGPTGLVLALGLARRGVPFRIIDAAAGPVEHSRAMAVHARTLEFYRQFGFADEMVAQGVRSGAMHMRTAAGHGAARNVMSLDFSEIGRGLSPYPFILAFPQDDHERFLIAKLAAAGGSVEWGAKLTGFTQDAHGARASISHADGRAELVDASHVCGCDGARSQVRHTLGAGFGGGDYSQLFYVADVRRAGGFDADLHVTLGKDILGLMLPVRSSGMQRLIGLVPPELSGRDDLTFEDIRARVEGLIGQHATEVNWFSTYHVHHRVADHFRYGRAFLLGDAAHIHSPAGGQGMNTGIGDAINLGWKLADVMRGRAGDALLDTYEPERIAFARTLVATTDRAFTRLVQGGLVGAFIRRVAAPLVLSFGARFEIGRRTIFRILSQIRIRYPGSALSAGKAGKVAGGDRLPWVPDNADDNFASLRSLDWQAHVYGEAGAGLAAACKRAGVPLIALAWNHAARAAGLARDALYLVRPDGHVALAAEAAGAAAALEAYVARLGLRLAA